MDRHLPGGTGLGKDMLLIILGTWLMIWTRTLFSNAGGTIVKGVLIAPYLNMIAGLGKCVERGDNRAPTLIPNFVRETKTVGRFPTPRP